MSICLMDISDRDIALKYIMTLYGVTEKEAELSHKDEMKEAIRLQKIGLMPWIVKDDKPEPDWTDDEFYEGAWSWVDECELEDKSDKDE